MGILSTLLGIVGNQVTYELQNAHLSGKEQEQNAYNSAEAEKQRSWSAEQNQLAMNYNSAEAEKQRSWSAEQNQLAMNYNSVEAEKARQFTKAQDDTLYQRRVADMRAAGINPALAIGGVGSALGSSAAGSISSPGGSSASASSPGGASASGSASVMPSSMSDLMQASLIEKQGGLLDSQIAMNDAKTMRDMAEAGLLGEQGITQRLTNNWFEPMKEVEFKNLLSDLDSKEVSRLLAKQNITESEARTALTLTQDIIAKADADTRAELNRLSIRRGMAEALGAEHRVDAIDQEIKESISRVLVNGLQGGLYSAETVESFERANLIRSEKRRTDIEGDLGEQEKAINEPRVNHKELDYILGLGGRVVGTVSDAAGGFMRGAIGRKFLRSTPRRSKKGGGRH